MNYLHYMLDSLEDLEIKDMDFYTKILQQMNISINQDDITESDMIFQLIFNLLNLPLEVSQQNTFILQSLIKKLSDKLVFLNSNQLKEINLILNKSKPNFDSSLYKPLAKQSNFLGKLTQEEKDLYILKYFQIDKLINSSKNLSLKSFNYDEKRMSLYDKEYDQEIIIYGLRKSFHAQVENIKSIFTNQKNQFNLIIIEEGGQIDTVFSQEIFSLQQSISEEKAEKMLLSDYTKHVMEGENLRQYFFDFLSNSNLQVDTQNMKVLQILGSFTSIESPLHTILLNFILNANRQTNSNSRTPKVVLADINISEYFKVLITKFTLCELIQLLYQFNYIRLIEKLRFAKNQIQFGCSQCFSVHNPKRKLTQEIPIQILQGDKNYPDDTRHEYCANRIADAVNQNKHYNKIMIVLGSFSLFPVISRFLRISSNKILREEQRQNNIDYLQLNQQFLKYIQNIQDFMYFVHQTSVLQVIHEIVNKKQISEMILDCTHQNYSNVNMIEYYHIMHRYGELYSYKYLVNPEAYAIVFKQVESDLKQFNEYYQKYPSYNEQQQYPTTPQASQELQQKPEIQHQQNDLCQARFLLLDNNEETRQEMKINQLIEGKQSGTSIEGTRSKDATTSNYDKSMEEIFAIIRDRTFKLTRNQERNVQIRSSQLYTIKPKIKLKQTTQAIQQKQSSKKIKLRNQN